MIISSTTEKVDSVSCEDSRPKRDWVYFNNPKTYGIGPCPCGNEDIEWSEFKDHVWCAACEQDFKPDHWGVFDGPILMEVAERVGMDFDRMDLKRDVYMKCVVSDDKIEYVDLSPEEAIARRGELKQQSDEFCAVGGFRLDGNKIVLNEYKS